jgi:hypothetical protein
MHITSSALSVSFRTTGLPSSNPKSGGMSIFDPTFPSPPARISVKLQ